MESNQMAASRLFNSAPDLAHDPQPVAAPYLGDILLLVAASKQGAGQVVKCVWKNDLAPPLTALAGLN